MNSTFKTLGHLLDNAVDTHRKAARLYVSLSIKAGDPRCRMLLEDMASYEFRMAKLVNQFVRQAQPVALDTYMQYTVEESPQALIREQAPDADQPTLKQISQMGQNLHEYQINLLEVARRELGGQEALELLDNLLQLEKAEGRSFALKTASAYEI